MNVTVYLGAHEGNNPVYKQAVAELATWIAQNGHRLVYGGSDEGLMAVIADTVLEQGGEVTGIEAQMFVDKGVAHKNLTQLTIVPNITERRTRMIELGDVFIAFPGGTGTFPPLMRKRTLLKRANTFLSRRLRTEKQALRSIRTAAVTCFATATASRPVCRADIGNCR